MPLNDTSSRTSPGSGNHWSLLVLHTPSKQAFHIDSHSSSNSSVAKAVFEGFTPLLSAPAGQPWTLQEVQVPQQENSVDCGVFVIAFGSALAASWSAHKELLESQTPSKDAVVDSVWISEAVACVTQTQVTSLRQELVLEAIKLAGP